MTQRIYLAFAFLFLIPSLINTAEKLEPSVYDFDDNTLIENLTRLLLQECLEALDFDTAYQKALAEKLFHALRHQKEDNPVRRILITTFLIHNSRALNCREAQHQGTLTMCAASRATPQEFASILKLNPDLTTHNSQGETALHYALIEHSPRPTQETHMQAQQLNITQDSEQCLFIATMLSTAQTIVPEPLKADGLKKIRMLLHKNPQLLTQANARGHTPLMYAVLTGKKELVEFFIRRYRKARIELLQRDAFGYTALTYAMLTCRPDIIQLLLRPDYHISVSEAKLVQRLAILLKGNPIALKRLEVIVRQVECQEAQFSEAAATRKYEPTSDNQIPLEERIALLKKAIMHGDKGTIFALTQKHASPQEHSIFKELIALAKMLRDEQFLRVREYRGEKEQLTDLPEDHPAAKANALYEHLCWWVGESALPLNTHRATEQKEEFQPAIEDDYVNIHFESAAGATAEPCQKRIRRPLQAIIVYSGDRGELVNLIMDHMMPDAETLANTYDLTGPYQDASDIVAWIDAFLGTEWEGKAQIMATLRAAQEMQRKPHMHYQAYDPDASIEEDLARAQACRLPCFLMHSPLTF